jgi:DNA repair exonuclease SbcCD ATPase subunit
MTDDLVKRLRAVDHLDIEDCFMQSPLYAYAADRIEALTTELSELQEVFDFQWRAHMRAVEMWRTANPGNDLVLPDSAKLTVWMLEQLEAARADAKEAEAYAEELERDLKTCRMAQAVMDNTVAELERECDDYAFKLADANNTYSEMHVALSEANDKLAKAVEVLRGCRETILQLVNSRHSEAEGTDEDWVGDIDTALAEIEGENG